MSEVQEHDAALDSRTWVVWSFEHDSWWASDRCGYVSSLLLAGLYTEAEAKEIERGANRDARKRNEEARPLAQALIDEREGWGRRSGMVIDVVGSALALVPAGEALVEIQKYFSDRRRGTATGSVECRRHARRLESDQPGLAAALDFIADRLKLVDPPEETALLERQLAAIGARETEPVAEPNRKETTDA